MRQLDDEELVNLIDIFEAIYIWKEDLEKFCKNDGVGHPGNHTKLPSVDVDLYNRLESLRFISLRADIIAAIMSSVSTSQERAYEIYHQQIKKQ